MESFFIVYCVGLIPVAFGSGMYYDLGGGRDKNWAFSQWVTLVVFWPLSLIAVVLHGVYAFFPHDTKTDDVRLTRKQRRDLSFTKQKTELVLEGNKAVDEFNRLLKQQADKLQQS